MECNQSYWLFRSVHAIRFGQIVPLKKNAPSPCQRFLGLYALNLNRIAGFQPVTARMAVILYGVVLIFLMQFVQKISLRPPRDIFSQPPLREI